MFEQAASASAGGEGLRERLRAALRQPLRRDPPARVAAVTEDTDLRILGGHWFETPHGPGYRIVSRYDVGFVHGTVPLYEALRAPLDTLAALARTTPPADIEALRFIDTETTGLAGAGAMVFLAGVARFEGSALVLSQYLLPGPEYEGGLLGGLADELAQAGGLVSYNGRSFDAPMLEARYVLQRMRPPSRSAPHVDLLHVSRRVFAEDLPSHRLVDVETRVLGFERGDDCPSREVPERYFLFQRTGDPSYILPVLRHNAWDVLSLVALLGRLGAIAAGEGEPLQRARAAEHAGDQATAAATYESAAEGAPRAIRRRALERAARAYARAGRPVDAVRCWLALAHEPPGRFLRPWVEAAKLFERKLGDLESALQCTEAAQRLLAAGLARPGRPGSGTSPGELAAREARLRARLNRW
ncbi:hypothetical protein HRbin29_01830 [bacterium HR29]|jgi:uncharacterized protein YprB with RNaseH-like and TPR domain|nr:hypothetical protein HRbin29_01830 [bacterium HR29]